MTVTTSLRSKIARVSVVSMLAVSALVTSGCFGKFGLTRKLYAWNEGVGDKWVRSVVMWGLMIIPVYPLVSTGDFLVLNTVEFWTGSNPALANDDVRTRELEGGAVEIARGDEVFRLVPNGERAFHVVRNGEPAGDATVREDGTVELHVAGGVALVHPGSAPSGRTTLAR